MASGLLPQHLAILGINGPKSVSPGTSDTGAIPVNAAIGWYFVLIDVGVFGASATVDAKIQRSADGVSFSDCSPNVIMAQMVAAGGNNRISLMSFRASDLTGGTTTHFRVRVVVGTAATFVCVSVFGHSLLGADITALDFASLAQRYNPAGSVGVRDEDCPLCQVSVEGNPMIQLRTGQWNLHREGVAELLKAAGQALCAGTALTMTAEVRLFTSANLPGCDDVAADYTEATFSGYAPVLIDSGDAGCTDILEIGLNESGVGQIVIDQQAWTEGSPATITETITGSYIVIIDGATELLLASFLFADVAVMGTAGDILKVNGFALLDCQMVEVP